MQSIGEGRNVRPELAVAAVLRGLGMALTKVTKVAFCLATNPCQTGFTFADPLLSLSSLKVAKVA
jgi:hypothetical protein